MADFVLDENVYVRGMLSEDTMEAGDRDAASLIHCLQLRHRWIVSLDVLIAYYRHFSRFGGDKGVVAHTLMTSLKLVLIDSDRHKLVTGPSTIPGDYDHDDDHIVSAVATTPGSVLITLDVRLRAALARGGIDTSYQFRTVDVATAWHEMCT